MYEDLEEQRGELAFSAELQPLHDEFLAIQDLWFSFAHDHIKGVVKRDVNAARRRARVASIELAKQLKDYRTLSNAAGKLTSD